MSAVLVCPRTSEADRRRARTFRVIFRSCDRCNSEVVVKGANRQELELLRRESLGAPWIYCEECYASRPAGQERP